MSTSEREKIIESEALLKPRKDVGLVNKNDYVRRRFCS